MNWNYGPNCSSSASIGIRSLRGPSLDSLLLDEMGGDLVCMSVSEAEDLKSDAAGMLGPWDMPLLFPSSPSPSPSKSPSAEVTTALADEMLNGDPFLSFSEVPLNHAHSQPLQQLTTPATMPMMMPTSELKNARHPLSLSLSLSLNKSNKSPANEHPDNHQKTTMSEKGFVSRGGPMSASNIILPNNQHQHKSHQLHQNQKPQNGNYYHPQNPAYVSAQRARSSRRSSGTESSTESTTSPEAWDWDTAEWNMISCLSPLASTDDSDSGIRSGMDLDLDVDSNSGSSGSGCSPCLDETDEFPPLTEEQWAECLRLTSGGANASNSSGNWEELFQDTFGGPTVSTAMMTGFGPVRPTATSSSAEAWAGSSNLARLLKYGPNSSSASGLSAKQTTRGLVDGQSSSFSSASSSSTSSTSSASSSGASSPLTIMSPTASMAHNVTALHSYALQNTAFNGCGRAASSSTSSGKRKRAGQHRSHAESALRKRRLDAITARLKILSPPVQVVRQRSNNSAAESSSSVLYNLLLTGADEAHGYATPQYCRVANRKCSAPRVSPL